MPRRLRGVVFAGGMSRRFGADKAMAELDGKTLLERAVKSLEAAGFETCVISHPDRLYPGVGVPVYADIIPGRGPLGGLYTACRLFPECRLLVTGCDMPFIRSSTWTALAESRPEERIVCFAEPALGPLPLPGRYDGSLVGAIEDLWRGNPRAGLKDLVRAAGPSGVIPDSAAMTPFNVNTPADLELCRNTIRLRA